MKRLLLICVLLCGSVSASTRVMTYNIQVKSWFTPSWENRKDAVVNNINYFQPDILCLQEATEKQVNDLLAEYKEDYPHFAGYTAVTFGKRKERYHNAILYSPARVGVVTSGTFDLGWGRGCVWALMYNKEDGTLYYVYDTHFAILQFFSEAQAKKTLDTINKRMYDIPVVLCGDLNATQDNKVLKILSQLLVDFGPNTPTHENGKKIDYIMGYKSQAVEAHVVETDKYASDHKPVAVVVDVEFGKGH